MILTFGKYRGRDTSEVPIDYLRWAYTFCDKVESDLLLKQDIANRLGIDVGDKDREEITPISVKLYKARIDSLEKQLREVSKERDNLRNVLREGQDDQDNRDIQQLIYDVSQAIDKAYRALAKKFHPDRGGSDEEMQVINNVIEYLRKVIDNQTTTVE